MKVLFTCNRLGAGGAERVICNLSNRMVKDKNEVRIVCLDVLEGFYYTLENNVEIIEIDNKYKTRKKFFDRKISGMRNFYRLMRTLKSEKPNVVISFYTRQNCYSILACSLLGIPVIAAERDHFFTIDSKVNAIMRRMFYPHATGFIHQTQWARKYLREHCKTKDNDIVLPNPLWIKNYPERKPIAKRVIAVGRLDEQKNYPGLIKSFKMVNSKIPNSELIIYGEGEQRSNLENLIEKLNLSNSVKLAGRTQEVLSCYSQADIFVLFSHGEGYPNVLMEALAMGVPCISANCAVGGPADMITDGENGILVKCDDEHELANKMVTLLSNEEMKIKYSNSALHIRETNNFEYIYKKLMDFVYKCMDGSNKSV